MSNYIGIDISKPRLDVDWLGKHREFKNDQEDIEKLIKELKCLLEQKKLLLVLCEASGGYEQKLLLACHTANIPIHVAHANHVRYFAKSKGIKAKTDKIDAKIISAYGKERKPQADTFLLNSDDEKIKKLLKRREQLLEDKKREKNRLDKINDIDVKQSIDDHIKWLESSLKKIDKDLSELRKKSTTNNDYKLLTSIPGIGDLLANYLITHLPEIGKISNKALSALAGVAPFNHDSGGSQGKRFIQGGRAVIRQVLYLAAMSSIRFNPELKVFYERLREKGKPGKLALVAVMRKLLSMANSVMARKTAWQPAYSTPA